jgi:PIN domain nuclease of toxin-antitoxin system
LEQPKTVKYLLHTLTFLWWVSDSAKLPMQVSEVIKHPDHSIYLSIASVREMQVKSQMGRLDLPTPVLDIVLQQHQENGIELLPISLAHMVALTRIPNYHGDPFDYLLISQAMVEDLTIITRKTILTKYPIKTFW